MACIGEFIPPMRSLQPLRTGIEANYNIKDAYGFLNSAWWVPLVACSVYLILVWCGKEWMKKREPFGLRGPLFVWNLSLAVFSIIGASVEIPPLFRYIREYGFSYSVCNTEAHSNPLFSFFCFVAVMSKMVEFGDTFFIVMRKTPLNFLHWYHHVTVCMFGWHSMAIGSAPAHWYCTMNYAVHSVMYSYYVLKSTGIRMPTPIAKTVTTLQLMQFIVGLIVVLRSTWLYTSGVPCSTNNLNSFLGVIIYGSYLILFSNFFYQRFVSAPRKKKQ